MSTTRTFAIRALLLATAALLLAGCSSFSTSSQSISSPSASLSRSSSPEAAYREDVGDVTAASIQSGGTAETLRRQIGKLASQHGITDWENNASTYKGMGEGLAKAGYRQVQVDAFKENMASTPEQAKWIQEGYDSAR